MKNGGQVRKMQTASGGPIYSTIEKSDNTRVSYNPIIEMSKRKGFIGTLAGIQLQTEHNEVQEKRKQEEANKKRQKKRKELEDKVNAQKKHSLSSPSLINAANDLQYMDTPEGQELAKMNREDETNESAYIASLPWWKKGMFYANKLVNAGFIPVGGGTTGMAAAKTPQQTLSGFISKFGEPGNLERTVNNIILENEYWLPKETGIFAQKHSSIGSNYRKIFERLWGKENTDRLTDDQLGKLILIRNHQIDTNIPQKGDFVYVVDGQAKAYRNGQEIGYLSNSYINNGKALHPEMVKKQGTNNAGVSELLYNGTILAENLPIISGSRLLMPEVTTHIWSKYPTRKLISTEGVHAWPLRTAQERGIKLNYEKNWHTQPEFSKQHQQALDENIRTNLIGQPIYELSEPSYLPMVKNARVFDISQLRDGYINLDFTPGFAYKQGGKMNILEFLKNGSGIHIKKKNRGKFTSYCGGKVTDECIRKAKASGNPTLVKRATFAQNSRRWKHEDGGEIKYSDPLRRIIKKHQTGGKTTFGQTIVNGALSLIKTSTDNKKIQADIEAQKAQNQADWAQIMKQIIKQNQQERNQQYQQWVNDYQSGRTMDQPSQIVAQHTNYEQLNQELAEGKQELTNKNNQLDVQANAEISSNWGNAIGGILQSGLGVVGDYLSSKGTTPATTGSSVYKVDSFWTNPTLKTSTPTYSFNTPTLTPPKTNYNFLK